MCGSYSSRSSMVHWLVSRSAIRVNRRRPARPGRRKAWDGGSPPVPAFLAQQHRNTPRRRALAAAGADRANGNQRQTGAELRARLAGQHKVCSGCNHARCKMHHVRMGDIAVREDRVVNRLAADECLYLGLLNDADAARIERTRQFRRIPPPRNVGASLWPCEKATTLISGSFR